MTKSRSTSPTRKKTAKKAGKKKKTKTKTAKKPNPWLIHIKKVKAKNPKLAFKDVLKLAAKDYKKV